MNDMPQALCKSVVDSIEVLNRECFCISLDTDALRQALESEIGAPGLFELVQERCPHLFATRPVFVSTAHAQRMTAVLLAVESVVALPAYRQRVLGYAPQIAHQDPGGARGVFFGYDFHLAADSFGLIEINTNAGGAMLNAVLARAQRACCAAIADLEPAPATAEIFESQILAMFRAEWSLAGHGRALARIAIVDEDPQKQYLYPEFLLFQRLFQRHGIDAVIADPADLRWQGGALMHADRAIDLVYNRLTDFSLAGPTCAALRQAYAAHAVVITPHPQAHALYADKRNLVVLTDAAELVALRVPPETRELLLASIPSTVTVRADNAEQLWSERKRWFFKPFGGFGGRAAFRGDKLTRRVWEEICSGGYVAQALVAPGERTLDAEASRQVFKFDLRAYAYDGMVQWLAARIYQGQTTNFRTPGGGFAPVYEGTPEGLALRVSNRCI